jgi:hypothetical protein
MDSFIFLILSLSIFLLLESRLELFEGLLALPEEPSVFAFFSLSRIPIDLALEEVPLAESGASDASFLGLPLPFLTGTSGSVRISNLLGVAIKVFLEFFFKNGFSPSKSDLYLSFFLFFDYLAGTASPNPNPSLFSFF